MYICINACGYDNTVAIPWSYERTCTVAMTKVQYSAVWPFKECNLCLHAHVRVHVMCRL